MIEAIKTTVAAGLGVSILPFEAVLRRPLPEEWRSARCRRRSTAGWA